MTCVGSTLSRGRVTALGPYGSSFDALVSALVGVPTAAKGTVVGPVVEPERLRRRVEEGRLCLTPPGIACAGAGTK